MEAFKRDFNKGDQVKEEDFIESQDENHKVLDSLDIDDLIKKRRDNYHNKQKDKGLAKKSVLHKEVEEY